MKPEDITAWALNELSPEERAQIEAELNATPQAQQKARETQAFCALLSEHLVDEDAALSADQRERLKTLELPSPETAVPFSTETETPRMNGKAFHAKVAAARERALPKPSPWMRIAALAACLTFILVVIDQSRKTPSAVTMVQKEVKALPEKPVLVAMEKSKEPLRHTFTTASPMPPAEPTLAMRKDSMASLDGALVQPFAKAASAPVPGLATAAPASAPAAGLIKAGAGSLVLSGANAYAGGTSLTTGTVTFGGATSTSTLTRTASPQSAVAKSEAASPAAAAGSSGTTLAMDSLAKAAKSKPRAGVASSKDEYYFAAGEDRRARMLRSMGAAWDVPIAASAIPHQVIDSTNNTLPAGTARYARVVENPFQTVQSQPLSTFSLDVDTASYSNVRRFLNAGQLPPPDAVRLEELINFFPYDYEQPSKDQPFSVQVDLAEAPWAPRHRLARIAIKGRDMGQERPAANFVFLIDVSGSMDSPERLPLVKQSLEMLTEQLREDDHVSIVTYAGACQVALESTSGKDKARIMEVIHGLHAGGSTNGESGITMAYNQAGAHFLKGGINRIILCTDGDFNVGISDADQLQQLIKQKAKGGTFLSVLGFGTDNLQDRTMEVLADNGNGNYAYIDSLGEARKVLVEQMRGTLITIAKDVKIQVEFNPALVASYRLIGYEKRLLAAKDFNNDKKDAGEIGAGHTVTALYEIVPAGLPMPNGALAEVDDLKYQPKNRQDKPQSLPSLGAKAPERVLEGVNDETMTVKLRYKAPDGELSKLIEVPVRDTQKTLLDSPRDFRFATAVAGFGMLLRDSEHVEDFGFEAVRRLALSGKGEDALGYRGEFIQLIDKAKGLKGK